MATLSEQTTLHRDIYDCLKCDRRVVFRFSRTNYLVDGNIVRSNLAKVISGGQCPEVAKVPDISDASPEDLAECPFFETSLG